MTTIDLNVDVPEVVTVPVPTKAFGEALETHEFGIPMLFTEGQLVPHWLLKCNICDFDMLLLGGKREGEEYTMRGAEVYGYKDDEIPPSCKCVQMRNALL